MPNPDESTVVQPGVASAEIGDVVPAPAATAPAAPAKQPRDAAKEGLVPVELLIAKHKDIDPFFVAYARGAGKWAKGKQLTEVQFLAAVEAAKGGKMHASLPPSLLKKKLKPARRPRR